MKFKKRTPEQAEQILKNFKITSRVKAPNHPAYYELGLLREFVRQLLTHEAMDTYIQKHEYGIYLKEARKEAEKEI